MHHQLNANQVSSYVNRKKIKTMILTTIKRGSSMDLKQSHFSVTSKAEQTLYIEQKSKLRRRSYSNSISTNIQDSKTKEVYKTNEFFKKHQENDDSSSQSNQSSKPINTNRQQDDLNNIYQSRKSDVNFRQFHQDFQLDVLQLEALYYWLSCFGFQRSTPFQIPPLLSYFIHSLILYRSDMFDFFFQFLEIYYRDQYYTKLRQLQSVYFQSTLQNQCLSQVQFYSVPDVDQHQEHIIVNYLNKLIHNLNLDYNILLEDFLTYSQLSNLQQEKIEQSLNDNYVYRKSNIAFGNIRFVFKQKDGLLIDFKQPIGKFEDRQFLDYLLFQAEFGQQISQAESINSFNQHCTEPHSERTLILFLLKDIELDISIFKNLNIDLMNQKKIDMIANLSQVYLEITTENRVCSKCVSMFKQIPVEFICGKFKEKFGLNIDERFQFIIISQYLLDPQIMMGKERYQQIWVRTVQRQKNQQIKVQKTQDFKHETSQNLENLVKNCQEGIQIHNQEEISNLYQQQIIEQNDLNDSQSVQKQEGSKQDSKKSFQQEEDLIQQEYLICYEEEEPTGLVSLLLLQKRYCKSEFNNFKTNIPQIEIKNTFFLSNESQVQSGSDSQNSQQLLHQDSNSQSSKSTKKQKYSNRLLDELLSYQNQLFNLQKAQQNLKKEQQFSEKWIVQKQEKTYKIYEDLLIETRSEFYALLIKRFTTDFQELNTQKFRLDKIVDIYWEIGFLRAIKNETHIDLIKILKEDLMWNSIIKCGQFNMKLFVQDYLFTTEFITPKISKEIRRTKETSKKLINFYLIKFYGLNESDQFQRIAQSNKVYNCNSFLRSIDKQIQIEIKNFKKILIIILSVSKINNKCTQAINNQILSLQHPNLELKYYFMKQHKIDLGQEDIQKLPQISEQKWKLLEIAFFKRRYALQNQDFFSPFKELSENADQELMGFECNVHNSNANQ